MILIALLTCIKQGFVGSCVRASLQHFTAVPVDINLMDSFLTSEFALINRVAKEVWEFQGEW